MSRHLQVIAVHILYAILVWLLDSLILYFAGNDLFLACLWSAVPPLRLLIRLLVVFVLLAMGFLGVFRSEAYTRTFRRLSPRNMIHLFGDPHSPRTGERLEYHALRLASLMRLSARDQVRLRLLCFYHDIGLVGVPQDLWQRYSDLTPAEQRKRDRHVDLGADIAANIPALAPAAAYIRYHEERFDGGGIKGLYGRSIPLACRIFAVVRMYDYFTRPDDDRSPLAATEALDELALYAGSVLDPDVVAAFQRLLSDDRLGEKVMRAIYS